MDGSFPNRHPHPGLSRLAARGAYRPFGAFRLALALMVALQHLQYLLPDADRAPFHTMGFGAIAVGVFFALSGFIVAEATDSVYAARPGAFLANRLLRVVPPYLAALAVSAAIQTLLWRAGHLALWDYALHTDPLDPALLAAGVLSLIPGFHTRYIAQDFEFIPFVWTLRVEMAFYLAAFAVALATRYAGRKPAWLPHAAVALGFAAFAAFAWHATPSTPAPSTLPPSTLALAALPPTPPGPAATPQPGALTAGRLDPAALPAHLAHPQQWGILTDVPFFLLGVCLYAALQPGRNRLRWAATIAAAACSLAAFGYWDQRGLPSLAAQRPLLAALLAGTAALAAWPRVAPAWRTLDKRLGALSYPLYLNHYAIGIALYDLVPGRSAALYATAVAASLALAWLMHRLVEAPMERLRTRIRGRPV